MLFDRSSIDGILLERLHAEERVSSTKKWAKHILKVPRNDYLHFYRVGPRSGLVDYPQKEISLLRGFRTFFYSYHKTSIPRDESYVWYFLRHIWIGIIDTWNQLFRRDILSKKQIAAAEYSIMKSANIKLPTFDLNHSRFYYNFDGYSFNSNLRKYCIYLLLIRPYFLNRNDLKVCEIGTGYGGLMELLAKNMDYKIYFAIDLIETLAISMTYLSNSSLADEYDLILLESPEEIDNITRKSIVFISAKTFEESRSELIKKMENIDLFINTESLGEMPPENVEEYFEFFQKFDNCYFFSANSSDKSPGCVPSTDFPYDENWNQVFEILDIGKKEIHTLSKR